VGEDGQAATRVRIELLGPLRLTVGGVAVDVPGPRRRAVLALLAMAGGRTVSTDELLDAVWPGEMPGSGRRALHSHVSRLRGHLGPAGDRLVREGSGYRLDLGPGELDVDEARALAGPGATTDALGRALSLWRGTALDEFAGVAPLDADAVAVAELRRDLTDDWLEGRLAADAGPVPPDLVEAATRAAAAEPLRERTHALLVTALARAGRQADALRAAHDLRYRMVEETGLDPGPAFAAVERAVAQGMVGAAPGPPARRLPARPASPLVGRDRELADLGRSLASRRLVTVVGPGGVGKTRLALEAAVAAADGGRPVTVVELAAVEDGRRVASALATALGLRVPDGEVGAAARDALAGGSAVLVLDNCEHVVDAARQLAAPLVDACPDLTVLATSRQPLGLAAEHVLRLGPLPVPEAGRRDIAAVPAVAAFLAHARRRQPDLELEGDDALVVADVVRRLDGLPLALELAAGRVGTLSFADLHDRLDSALDLLEGGRAPADARHRTLRDTIDWSFRTLDPAERRLLCRISVFPGGVDLATAERLGARPGAVPARDVARLVDTSMLGVEQRAGGFRYRPLETVRAFALDHLAADGERDAADDALLAWAVDLAADARDLAGGPDEPAADARVRAELPNLLAAWDLATRRADVDARVALVTSLDTFLLWRDLTDLAAWSLDLVADPALEGHPRRAEIVGMAAQSAWHRGDLGEAVDLAERSRAEAPTPEAAAPALDALAAVALFRGAPEAAADLWLAAYDLSPPRFTASRLASAALGAVYAGRDDRARALLDRAVVVTEAEGAPSDQAFVRYAEAELLAASDPHAAADLYARAVTLARSAGATFVEGVASVGLVRLWAADGRTAAALDGYAALLADWRRAGHWTQLWTTLRNLAGPLADAGQVETGALVLHAADAAPEAALVTVPAVAVELAALVDRLDAELGPERAAAARRRAAGMTRVEVVEAALAAVAAARA
jgi:predicted ATPase/DNA-binding SARP family transcriptional activator